MSAAIPEYVIISVAATATWVATFPSREVLGMLGIVDRPNARSSHQSVTIRGAGVAIVAVISVVMAIVARETPPLWFVLGLFVVLAAVSFTDDIKGLPARLRFAVHAAVAAAGVAFAFRSGEPQGLMAVPLAAAAWLWIAGYTNAFNFMDGINGIAGMQALVTGAGTGLIALQLGLSRGAPVVLIAFAAAGAALGFLPHNFPRARVFMGDVGSAPLGFLLSTLAVWIAAETHWWVLVWISLLHANFVFDTGITVVRRVVRKEQLSQAHREHFYQRLVRAGRSHTSVTLIETGLQVLVALAVWWTTNARWPTRVAVGSAIVVVWLGFFGFAEYLFRKSPAGIAEAGMQAARHKKR